MKTYEDFGIEIPHNSGGEVYTTCPECSKDRKKRKAKCLSVNTDKQVWICHHCGWTGTLEGRTHKLEAHWNKPEFKKPSNAPKPSLPEKTLAWFHNRGITDEVLFRNKIGQGSVYMPQIEDFTSAISFPYFRGGELLNIKWRDSKKNFRLEAGAERILYGLDDIQDQAVIIWVEGEIDKLSVEVAGFKNCVSVPDGAPPENTKNYSSKFDYLDLIDFDSVGKHILFLDNDGPGQKLEEELSRRLGREKCERVKITVKDANELLVMGGAAMVKRAIEHAEPYPVSGIHTGKSLFADVDRLYNEGKRGGLKTGWRNLDPLYSVRPGEWTLVTGIPNSGKSNWLDNLASNLAVIHGWRFGVFSPENQPLEDHFARFVEKHSRIPFFNGAEKRIESLALELEKDWVADHFDWILPDTDDEEFNLSYILHRAKTLVFRRGIRGLIIDPWNEIDHTRPQGLSETEYISQSLTRIRKFARQHSVHVWLVAHPTKLQKGSDGQYPVPTPYDVSGSAHWRNKSDNAISVYRHFTMKGQQEKPIEIHVQKIRFREVGRLGMAELDYEIPTGTYADHQENVFSQRYGGAA